MEVFRVPPILCISLKRFRIGRSKYGFSSSGTKIDTMVDFPLEGLDMREYVLSGEQRQEAKLVYDCFAISNHMGNVGFGHYTAYGKSVTDNNWYSFDDSHVTRCRDSSQVVTNSAYSIFYRLRGFSDLNNIDFKKIEKVPSEAYWKTVKK